MSIITSDDVVAALVAEEEGGEVEEESSSYNLESMSFESAFSDLVKVSKSVARQPPRAASSAVKQSSSPTVWLSCVTKLGTAFEKVSDSPSFRAMFSKFVDAHSDSLVSSLFSSDEDVVNDSFFKSVEPFDFYPTGTKDDAVKHCGPVVFYNMENATFNSVCLPIGEIYREAVKRYLSANENDVHKRVMPTLVLLNFYAVLYFSLPDDHPAFSAIGKNVQELCDVAEAIAPGTGPAAAVSSSTELTVTNDDSNNPFGGMQMDGLISMAAGLFGSMGGGGGAGAGADISNAIKGMGGMVKTLVDEITKDGDDMLKTADGNVDPAAIVARLGSVFQSQNIQQQIAETARSASSVFAGMAPSPSPLDEQD